MIFLIVNTQFTGTVEEVFNMPFDITNDSTIALSMLYLINNFITTQATEAKLCS